jgi:zinc protease
MTTLAGRMMLAAALIPVATASAQPEIEHWRTDNGARVYFVGTDSLPIVDVRLTFDAGGARDGDTPGLARLTNELITAGAGDLDAGAIARGFEDNGARLDNSSRQDMAYLHLRSLSEPARLDPGLELFRRVVAKPTFPADDLERTRSRMLVRLQQDQQDPGEIADRRLSLAMYGDHPYGTPAEGTVDGLRGIDRADVRAFYERYYTARNMVVAIVGDVSRRRAESIAHSLSQARPGGKAAPPLPEVSIPDPQEPIRVDFGSQQTHILLGQPAVARGSADWHALYAANHILGGSGLTSRLSMEMREKRGLSYSTHSYFAPAARAGRFVVRSQVRNDKRDEALSVLRENVRAFHADGPTPEELESAKRQITGSFPLNLDSNRDILGYVAMIGFYHLPLDYLASFRDSIEALTTAEVASAFRAHVDPDRLVTVMVGPFPDSDAD